MTSGLCLVGTLLYDSRNTPLKIRLDVTEHISFLEWFVSFSLAAFSDQLVFYPLRQTVGGAVGFSVSGKPTKKRARLLLGAGIATPDWFKLPIQ